MHILSAIWRRNFFLQKIEAPNELTKRDFVVLKGKNPEGGEK